VHESWETVFAVDRGGPYPGTDAVENANPFDSVWSSPRIVLEQSEQSQVDWGDQWPHTRSDPAEPPKVPSPFATPNQSPIRATVLRPFISLSALEPVVCELRRRTAAAADK
jgi:hypothetical protein